MIKIILSVEAADVFRAMKAQTATELERASVAFLASGLALV